MLSALPVISTHAPICQRPALEDGFQDGRRAVAILDVGSMDDHSDQQAQRIDDDVALAALDLLGRCPGGKRSAAERGIEATKSAAFGGFTLWLWMTPAGGLASRPSLSRAAMTSSLFMARSKPSYRQRQKYFCTVENGGKSFGRSRYAQPDEAMGTTIL